MENNEFEKMNNTQDTQNTQFENNEFAQEAAQNNIFSSNSFANADTAPIPDVTKSESMPQSQTENEYNNRFAPEPEEPISNNAVPQQNRFQPYNPYAYPNNNNVNQNSNPYSDPYNAPQQYNHQVKTKKKGKGKKVALVICALVLTLGIGAGGGILGSYLLNNNQTSITEESSAKEKTSSTSVKKDNSSSLIIKQASDTEITPTTTQEVAAKVKDAVVEITTETTTYDSFYGQYISQAAGSGVIISEDGYLLTNNHVIDGATNITVRLTNSKTYKAQLIGKDATLDVALLKIEEKGLTTATFGDSAKLNVGQAAIAIGNPLGQLGGTVTDGIISALDREITIDGKKMNLLQTNAAINPGNSGGGLFDSKGNLIGLVVAKSSSTSSGTSVEGLGFAIPVNDIIDILNDLKVNGRVTGRAYLGVNLVDITTQNAMFMYRVDKMGVYVSAVGKDSAAEKAGLQIYDLITKVDDKEISEASELTAIIAKHKSGDKVKITVERDGETKVLDVTLGERPDETTEEESSETQRNYRNSGGIDDDELFRRFFGDNW